MSEKQKEPNPSTEESDDTEDKKEKFGVKTVDIQADKPDAQETWNPNEPSSDNGEDRTEKTEDKSEEFGVKTVDIQANKVENDSQSNPDEMATDESESSDESPVSESDESKYVREKKVIIHAEAYKSIILYATRYANASIPRSQWREIYGILIGVISDDAVIVERAEPMTYGESHDVELGPEHYGFIAEIQDQLDAEGKGRFMVGWFHSHPGLSLFYSYVDIYNQISFQQANPDFVGIVFDHTYLLHDDLRPTGYSPHVNPNDDSYKVTPDNPNHPFNTGIVAYRLNDPFMDQNNPYFDDNYHDVDYEILGLNQFFFANLLTELSSYATQGAPLQKAYREPHSQEPNASESPQAPQIKNKDQQKGALSTIGWKNREPEEELELQKIDPSSSVSPSVNNSAEDPSVHLQEIPVPPKDEDLSQEERQIKKVDQLITDGKTSFIINDSFSAVEKYRAAIDILDDMGPNYSEKLLQTYNDVAESCLESDHDNLAIEFSEKLKVKAEELGDMFQMGNADYLKGKVLLNKNETQDALASFQNAAIFYEKVQDYAGVGKINELIGSIYKSGGNMESYALFTTEAVANYNKATEIFHRKRRSAWALKANLKNLIADLKQEIISSLSQIDDENVKNKIIKDLDEIKI